MLSVLKNTKTPVKFWFLKNYLSPTFKVNQLASRHSCEDFLLTAADFSLPISERASKRSSGNQSETRSRDQSFSLTSPAEDKSPDE